MRTLRRSLWIARLAIVFATLHLAHSAEFATLAVPSAAMKCDITAGILIPKAHASSPDQRFPVVYVLDGYSGNGTRILSEMCKDTLPAQADELGLVMVSVGCVDKWYFDSPLNPEVRWQTFLTNELIPYIDQHYRTIAQRSGRAITGLSMGGHGAFFTAFRNPSLFLAAGSTSGGVDFRPFPTKWDIAKQLGPMDSNAKVWDENVAINNLTHLTTADLNITFDCGTNDFFLAVNRSLHERLNTMNVAHTYEEFPGGHTAPYWQKSFPHQMKFFAACFAKANTKL